MISPGNKASNEVLPGPGQAHLWLLDFEKHRGQKFSADCMVLDDREKERARAFKRSGIRQRYCLTRTVVRNVLSHYFPQVGPFHWRFNRNQHGKPGIAAPAVAASVQFNISHSGRWLAIVVSPALKIGVDVEKVTDERAMLAIARRHFSAREYSYLCDLAPEKLASQFYALWTLKEAYSKACGNALVPTLGELELGFPDSTGITAVSLSTGKGLLELTDWQFALFSVGEYRLALAMQSAATASGLPSVVREIEDPFMLEASTELGLRAERLSH